MNENLPVIDEELPVETIPEDAEKEEKPADNDEVEKAGEANDEADESAEDQADDEDHQDEDEAEQAEYVTVTADDGTEYEVPKSLAGSFMMDRDYRQKTQTLAEQRREFEDQRKHWEEVTKTQGEEDLKLASEVFTVDQQLKQYENVDWNQLDDNDPDGSQRHWRNYQMLRQRKEDLGKAQNERLTQRSQEAQQAVAKRVEETRKYAEANIPNWSESLLNEIEEYAVGKAGMPMEEVASNMSPAFMQILHDAHMADKIRGNANKAKRTVQSVKPTKQIKAKSSGTKRINLADASMEDYQRLRRQGANPRLT